MKKSVAITFTTIMLAFSSSFAANKADTKFTKEDRQKMADVHTKMAQCLNSDKPLSDCRKEMMDSCQGMGKDGCPMMGMGHMMDSKKRAMMDRSSDEPASKK